MYAHLRSYNYQSVHLLRLGTVTQTNLRNNNEIYLKVYQELILRVYNIEGRRATQVKKNVLDCDVSINGLVVYWVQLLNNEWVSGYMLAAHASLAQVL